MKKIIVLLACAAVLFYAAKLSHTLLVNELKTNLVLNTKVANIRDGVDAVRKGIMDGAKGAKRFVVSSVKKVSTLFHLPQFETDAKAVKLYLKHGAVIEGILLGKKGGKYTIEWDGRKYEISRDQVKSLEYVSGSDIGWPYKNGVVVRKMDQTVVDAEIGDADADGVTLNFREGGGLAEMHIPRKDIDCLVFAPVFNRESREIESRLRDQFPKMKTYTEGNVTIFTDSYITSVRAYRKTLRTVYADIYLKFFRLFKGRKPLGQNFVVIFDDFEDYVVYAATDGIPGWLAVGYFSPLNKVLYTFNAFGERMQKLVFDVIVGKTGKFEDAVVDPFKKKVDTRYHIFIDALAKKYTDKYWEVYNLYRGELTTLTHSVIRHEFTHELFHNWGLQNIILSKPNVDKKKLLEKKKEIMETKDWKKKEELLRQLLKLRAKEASDVDMAEIVDEGTAQSWLNEGMATYCGTDPLGGIDEERLFAYQEAARKGELNPIEFLTSFKMGSFPGLCLKSMLVSYAQSWAFTTFLVNRYPDQFIEYQRILADKRNEKETKVKAEDELNILLKCLNKDLPTLEKEFKEYMDTYPKAEDPDVKRFIRYHQVWEDLLRS